MSTEENLLRILGATEKQLLDAIAKAAKEGDLAAVDQARAVAGQIRRMTAEIESRKKRPHVPNRGKERKNGEARTRIENGTPSKKSYPEFSARNGTLYRLAWSRKKQSEYEHRVPKDTIDLIVHSMSSFGNSDRRPIEVEKVAASVNRSSVIQIPQYQVYLVVSWLRHLNCIEQVGRDGYRIPPGIEQLVEQEWKLLSSKQDK